MKIEPLGDAALLIRELPVQPFVAAEAIRALKVPGVVDVSASYETVGVYSSSPGILDSEALASLLSGLNWESAVPSTRHRIPVCYDKGEDLGEIADHLSLSKNQVVQLHASVEYTCFAVGFCPGFAYLGWLPEALSGVPRRPLPRVRVEPGSVGLTGKQTGVYPLVRPGGWALVGRTPLTLVDEAADYFPIKAGDRVSFYPIDEGEFEALVGERLT